jgi:hypothetical protein
MTLPMHYLMQGEWLEKKLSKREMRAAYEKTLAEIQAALEVANMAREAAGEEDRNLKSSAMPEPNVVIRFKDTASRKFQFPWDISKT